MSPVLKRPVLKRLVPVALVCAVALSGCAVADTPFRPGVAATVGDESIPSSAVDDLALEFCDAVSAQLEAQDQELPLFLFTNGIANQVVVRSAVDQLAADYGVETSEGYLAQLDQVEAEAQSIPEEHREAFIEVQSTPAYIGDLLIQVGSAALEEEGGDGGDAASAQARGEELLTEWFLANDVEIDPRYGVGIVEGQPQTVDTQLSVATSDLATAGLSQAEPDPAYLASLPQSATCG